MLEYTGMGMNQPEWFLLYISQLHFSLHILLDCSRAMFHEVVEFLQKSLISKGRVHGGLAQGLLLFYFSEQLN